MFYILLYILISFMWAIKSQKLVKKNNLNYNKVDIFYNWGLNFFFAPFCLLYIAIKRRMFLLK